jgi:glycopeptide antibiotics resistance protein
MRWVVRHAGALLGVYMVLLAIALFSPSSEQQSGAVVWLEGLLRLIGAPQELTSFDRLEVLMNAVIVAPATFLASLVLPQYGWRDWTCFGFVAAVTVEGAQGLLLPGRQASFSDVVANTAGALAGAVLLHGVRYMAGSRSMLRASRSD